MNVLSKKSTAPGPLDKPQNILLSNYVLSEHDYISGIFVAILYLRVPTAEWSSQQFRNERLSITFIK